MSANKITKLLGQFCVDMMEEEVSSTICLYNQTIENKNSASSLNLMIEQGHEIGRDGRIQVTVTNKGQHVIEVTCNAVYVNEFEVSI